MPKLNKIGTALSRSHHRPAADPVLRRLRIALTAFFAVDGFLFAGWVVRIPAIKAQVGASAGQLGLALLGVSAGAVATMVLTGRMCRSFGSERVTVVTGVMLSLSIALPPRTHSALALGLVLLCFGTSYGGLNVAMNSAAVDLVAALRRPVMSGFHAAYSLGGLIGAGLGGLLAPHLSPATHLLLLTPVGLVVVAAAGRVVLAHPIGRPPARAHEAGARRAEARGEEERQDGARRRRGEGGALLVAVFGLIAACTAYGEGALAEWGPLHIQQDLHGGPGIAAAGYACVAMAMTLGRLSGTTLIIRLGRTRALVLGGLTACAGMLLGALAPALWLVMAGFALTGLGLANLFPTAIALAGELTAPAGWPPPPPWVTAACSSGRPRSASSPTPSDCRPPSPRSRHWRPSRRGSRGRYGARGRAPPPESAGPRRVPRGPGRL